MKSTVDSGIHNRTVIGSVVLERPPERILKERFGGLNVSGVKFDVIDLLVIAHAANRFRSGPYPKLGRYPG